MLYKKFQDIELSALGLGCMRFPVLDGDDGRIDEEKAGEIVRCAMENGVNYYDTAWPYHNGQSEPVMGRILSKYPREAYYLASKFPGYLTENFPKAEEIFTAQLERCQVDHFDFYLFHSVSDGNIDGYLDQNYRIIDFFRAQKKAGRIRHLGFSTHGSLETVERFLAAFPEAEFCQIQLNYMDWTFQRAQDKVKLLRERGIPVWVMEPVRGGRLASLDKDLEARLRALRPEESIPAWAFRFLQSIDGVGMVLSGMSSLEQVRDNIKTMSEARPLSPAELEALLTVAQELTQRTAVPCTACRYCTAGCPQHISIPDLFAVMNAKQIHRDWNADYYYDETYTKSGGRASDCIRCGKCEKVCPQHLHIRDLLADVAAEFEKKG